MFNVTHISVEQCAASCLFFLLIFFFFRKHLLRYRDFSHCHISYCENNTHWNKLLEKRM